MSNIRRLGVLVALSGVMLLALMLLVFAYAEVGAVDEAWDEGLSLAAYDLSEVPVAVAEDANRLAAELVGSGTHQDFVDQLLATYLEAQDKDVVVVFNSGGWGWNMVNTSPGWSSILEGIQNELDDFGYDSLLLNYRRTSESLWACAKELFEVTTSYPSKAKFLTGRVEFLVDHIPDLRVIVAGESNGSVIADCVMYDLREKPQVYSIQTGMPFWHRPMGVERTLVLNNNGTGPDSFSEGDLPAMFNASAKHWFGFSGAEEREGEILDVLQAPGHDYSWAYPEVYSQITSFIVENFSIEELYQ